MTFFDDAWGDEAGSGSEQLHARPEGTNVQPPRDWVIPTILPLGRRIAASDSAVVSLDALECWPDGVGISVRALTRFSLGLPGRPGPNREGLHIGVVFADGRQATCVDGGRHSPRLDRRSGVEDAILLMSGGSRWGRFHRAAELYLAPLPPEGPLTVVVQWLECGIEETRAELDSAAIRAAAATVTDVWSDLPSAPKGVRTTGDR